MRIHAAFGLILLALLVGCSDTRVPVGAPHAFGPSMLVKGSADFHGALSAQCSTCHDPAVFCGSCHFGPSGSREPQGSGWTHGKPSHSGATLVAESPVCVACHEIKRVLSGAPANSTCTGCHEGTFTPHATYGDAHRAAALADLKSCQPCHGAGGTSFSGGVTPTSCATCHTASGAHPTDWQGSGAFSHREAGKISEACVLCHDVFAGRTAPLASAPSCFSASFTNADGQNRSCHAGGWRPHPLPYADAALHGPSAKSDLTFCQNCHGTPGTTAFSGGSSEVSCQGCHTDARAHPTDWQGSGTYSHRASGRIAVACAVCHDYTNGRTPPLPQSPSCYSANFTNADGQARPCHPAGPTGHPKGQAWLDKKSATFHGDSSLTCSECHATATFCGTCHFGPSGSKVPQGSSWTHGSHSHKSLSGYRAVCNKCHTLDRSYGNGPRACHDCHDD